MTAIAGFIHGNEVWIGGDSAGCSGWDLTLRSDPKVFRNGEFIIGFTSSFRMGQLLRYEFIPPEYSGEDLMAYMCSRFVSAIRHCFQSGGYAEKEKDRETAGVFLVGFSGRLFYIDGDYNVGEPLDGYDACGCGSNVARGALFATRTFGLSPEERMNLVLNAAERHTCGVRGPFTVEHI